jgi:ParB family chromosome partitioning protein
MAGLSTVPAIIREFNDTEMMEIALLENLQREDLNPIEEANAYIKIMEAKNLTHDELAKVLGKSQSYITNMIGLVRLPEEVKQMPRVSNKYCFALENHLGDSYDETWLRALTANCCFHKLNGRLWKEAEGKEDTYLCKIKEMFVI